MKERILFFASGDFPVKTFKSLIENGYNIVGLVSSYDKHTFKDNDIEKLADIAVSNNIPMLIPNDLNSEETYEWIKDKNTDIFCVISYKKLSERILSLAKTAAFNIHASVLPFLRGAAPINHAIRLGFKETGLTAFLLNDKIDCGDIIDITTVKIEDDDNFETLFWKLSDKCVRFTENVLHRISEGNYTTVKQSTPFDSEIFKAPKITKDYTNFWSKRGLKEVENLLRSIYPVDGLHMTITIHDKEKDTYKDISAKILGGEVIKKDYENSGIYQTDKKTYLRIWLDFGYTTDCWFNVTDIQIAGKRRMKIAEFLRGFQSYLNKEKYNVYFSDN